MHLPQSCQTATGTHHKGRKSWLTAIIRFSALHSHWYEIGPMSALMLYCPCDDLWKLIEWSRVIFRDPLALNDHHSNFVISVRNALHASVGGHEN